jgi:hypothetical protein
MATADRAMDRLRVELEARFGKAIATLIMISAANEASVPLAALKPEDFQSLVGAIGNHPRVVSHWGDDVAAEVDHWRSLDF